MSSAQHTHVAKPADRRRITLCAQSIDAVPLAPHGDWPTCAACASGIVDNPRVLRAVGLELPTNVKGLQP